MTDHFAILNEPRRPWIDPDLLKQKFLTLSSQVHPDRVHEAPEAERLSASRQFSEVNSAYNCLREPKDRLRHLLELELGTKPADVQGVPQEVMDSFFEIGRLYKEIDAFLNEKAKVTSPILKVGLIDQAQEWTDKLNAVQRSINARRGTLFAELQAMNSAWEAGATTEGHPLARLETIYRLLGYFGRWSEQMQERIVQLSF